MTVESRWIGSSGFFDGWAAKKVEMVKIRRQASRLDIDENGPNCFEGGLFYGAEPFCRNSFREEVLKSDFSRLASSDFPVLRHSCVDSCVPF